MRIPSAVVPALVLAHAVGMTPCTAQAASAPEVTASLAVDTRAGARGCVSRADLVARITRRSSRIRVVAERVRSGPVLRAVVEAAASGMVTVSLSFAWPGGTRSERRLSARSCAEAADAVALVIVLALDPGAAAAAPRPAPTSAPPSSPTSTGAEPVPVAPGPTAVLPPPAAPAPEPPPPPPPLPPPPPPPAVAESAPASASPTASVSAANPEPAPVPIPASSRFWVGAGMRAVTGPAPRLLMGPGLVAAWELERASVWSPLAQVVATYYLREDTGATGGTATFGLDAIALQLCPLRVGARLVSVRLCAAASGGRLVARGSDTFNARSRARPLFTAGGAALLAVNPHPRFELAASVEPAAALVRDQFAFDPITFYAVPRLILTFGLGVAVKFP